MNYDEDPVDIHAKLENAWRGIWQEKKKGEKAGME